MAELLNQNQVGKQKNFNLEFSENLFLWKSSSWKNEYPNSEAESKYYIKGAKIIATHEKNQRIYLSN